MRPATATATAAALAALAALSPVARAEPQAFAAGVSIGRSEDEQGYTADANRTLGLWGRIGLNRRISGQLELQQIESAYGDGKIRSGTVLIVLDLIGEGRLVPMLLAGAGLDRASYFGGEFDGHHFEGGIGLEYRASNGLFVGADVRLGGRSLDNGNVILDGGGVPPFEFAPAIVEGEYRAARLTIGVRF